MYIFMGKSAVFIGKKLEKYAQTKRKMPVYSQLFMVKMGCSLNFLGLKMR